MIHPAYSIHFSQPPPPPGLFNGVGGGSVASSSNASHSSSSRSRSSEHERGGIPPNHAPSVATSSVQGSGSGMAGGDPFGMDAPFAAASSFLSSIRLRVDPSLPPPPLYPSVPFAAAIAALAGVSAAEWAHWASLRQQASEAFLAHIPLGHESADQRPQPLLHLPHQVLQQREQRGGMLQLDGANALPAFQPALSAATSLSAKSPREDAAAVGDLASVAQLDPALLQRQLSSLGLVAPSAVRAGSGLRHGLSALDVSGGGVGGGGMIPASGELLLYAAGDGHSDPTAPPSPAAANLLPPPPLPLRLQTPPLLMGMGASSSSNGGGGGGGGGSSTSPNAVGGGATPAVGAHLFGNPLMFPATLSAPLDLSRSTTEQLSLLQAQAAAQARLARPLHAGRSSSEFPQSLLLSSAAAAAAMLPSSYGGLQPGMIPPFTSPILSTQHSAKASLGGGLVVNNHGGGEGSGSDVVTPAAPMHGQGGDESGLRVLPLGRDSSYPKDASERRGVGGDSSAAAAASATANGGGSGGDGADLALAGAGSSMSMMKLQPSGVPPPAVLFPRADGTGHGLRDRSALFVSLNSRPAEQSVAEWERELLDRGLLDARMVVTPQLASSSVSKAAAHATAAHHQGKSSTKQQQQHKHPQHRQHMGGGLGIGMGGPMFVSSIQPYVVRDSNGNSNASSSTTTAPHTPQLGSNAHGLALAIPGRSRGGSFSLDPPALPVANSGLLALGLLGPGSGGGGGGGGGGGNGSRNEVGEADVSSPLGGSKNSMLRLVAVTAAAAQAQELEDAGGDEELLASQQRDGVGLFGKRQGISYAYLLPPRPKTKTLLHAHKSTSSTGGGSASDSDGPNSAGGGNKKGTGDGGEDGKGNNAAGSGSGALAATKTLGASSSSAGDDSVGAQAGGANGGVVTVMSSNDLYSPLFLDDPSLKSGKHRVVLQLAGFMSSLASYVRSKELRAELNASFAARHSSWLPPSAQMSLSKLLKCKQLLLDLVVRLDLELATLAVAYIYLEKMVLLRAVHKANRKLVACVCLLLAFKWSEGSERLLAGGQRKKLFAALFLGMEKQLHVPRAAIVRAEFAVFAALGFDLTVKQEHVLHHFRQALAKLDTVPQDYKHIEWSL